MNFETTASARLEKIATASSGTNGVTRLPWTSEHRAALVQISDWMKDAGLLVSVDAAGTLIGQSPNPHQKPVLLIGSHQDSVPSGGAFDGIMGIALACLVARDLRDKLRDFPFALEILAFADEEGVRFPTALIGPRAIAGTLPPDTLDMCDAKGITMRDAMTDFGVDPGNIHAIARTPMDVFGYLEAHIEQGPVLEDRNRPVAAVSAICGISRHIIRITGETGHAGTVPMQGRRDALVAAARLISGVSEAAGKTTDLRATVGQISVHPGAVNAIPQDVEFPLEIRAPDDTIREAFEGTARQMLADISGETGTEFQMSRTYVQPAAICDPGLTAALEHAMDIVDCGQMTIPSGATHDASAMAEICPIAMLFVRCRGGISHRPDEFAETKDMDVAVKVMVKAIQFLAEKPAN